MSKKIKYQKVGKFELKTPCPYKQRDNEGLYYVGSFGCTNICRYCILADQKNETIECNYPEERILMTNKENNGWTVKINGKTDRKFTDINKAAEYAKLLAVSLVNISIEPCYLTEDELFVINGL